MKFLIILTTLFFTGLVQAKTNSMHIKSILTTLVQQGVSAESITVLPNVRNQLATISDTVAPGLFGGDIKAFHYKILVEVTKSSPISCDRVTILTSSDNVEKVIEVLGISEGTCIQ